MLKDRPYLDAKRVGVWGWSGGGSMTLNALFRYPDLYHAGISIAPVPDQRLYDTIYQERYMGLPKDNADGYKNGSPITFAKNLKGKLQLNRWHGPAYVLGHEGSSGIYLGYRGNVTKCAPEAVRAATPVEQLSATGWVRNIVELSRALEQIPEPGGL